MMCENQTTVQGLFIQTLCVKVSGLWLAEILRHSAILGWKGCVKGSQVLSRFTPPFNQIGGACRMNVIPKQIQGPAQR